MRNITFDCGNTWGHNLIRLPCGQLVLFGKLNKNINRVQIPISMKNGSYITARGLQYMSFVRLVTLTPSIKQVENVECPYPVYVNTGIGQIYHVSVDTTKNSISIIKEDDPEYIHSSTEQVPIEMASFGLFYTTCGEPAIEIFDPKSLSMFKYEVWKIKSKLECSPNTGLRIRSALTSLAK